MQLCLIVGVLATCANQFSLIKTRTLFMIAIPALFLFFLLGRTIVRQYRPYLFQAVPPEKLTRGLRKHFDTHATDSLHLPNVVKSKNADRLVNL